MNKFFYAIAILLMPAAALACDICGCGAGNNYIGILPEFQKHVAGLRYRYNALFTHIGADGRPTYLSGTETFHIAEAWGGWNVGKNLRLMATVPYAFNQKIHEGMRHQKSGLSDVTVSSFYQLLNTRHGVLKKSLLAQSLWIGGGVKLPTGQYNAADKNSAMGTTNLFQLGTGSTDVMASAIYDVRLQDAGLNLASAYKINGANKEQYRYGNKLNVSAQLYYKWRIKNKYTIAPNAGAQYEQMQTDRDKGFEVYASGGNLWLGTAGVEISLKRIAIGANYQTPLQQSLAHGMVKAGNRMMAHVSVPL